MQLYYKDDVSAVRLQTRAACTETTSTTTHLAVTWSSFIAEGAECCLQGHLDSNKSRVLGVPGIVILHSRHTTI